MFSLPLVPMIARLRPAAAVRARGRRRPRARARRRSTASRASSTSPPTGCWRSRRSIGLLGKRPLPVLPPVGHRPAGGAAAARSGSRSPTEMHNLLRFGRGVDNRRYKATRLRLRLHDPRGGAPASASTCGCEPILRGRRVRPTPTSARSRSSCAGARTSRPPSRSDRGRRRRSRAARHLTRGDASATGLQRHRVHRTGACLHFVHSAPCARGLASFQMAQGSDLARRDRLHCDRRGRARTSWDSLDVRPDRRGRDDRRRRRRRDDRRRGPQGRSRRALLDPIARP